VPARPGQLSSSSELVRRRKMPGASVLVGAGDRTLGGAPGVTWLGGSTHPIVDRWKLYESCRLVQRRFCVSLVHTSLSAPSSRPAPPHDAVEGDSG